MTPHAIKVYLSNNNIIVIEPSGKIARVTQKSEHVTVRNIVSNDTDSTVDLKRRTFGNVDFVGYDVEWDRLPYHNKPYIIVSSMVLDKCVGKDGIFSHCVAPDDFVRSEDGKTLGCHSFTF